MALFELNCNDVAQFEPIACVARSCTVKLGEKSRIPRNFCCKSRINRNASSFIELNTKFLKDKQLLFQTSDKNEVHDKL